MRPLIISALAATLIGCTWFAPQQAQQASWIGHSAAGTPRTNFMDAKTGHLRHQRRANSDTKIAKPNTVPKMDAASCIQPDVKSDPVLKKAMPTIATKMENSAFVELVEMKRAKKNALGRSIDTICGYVRGKNASGSETGDKPFLYLVQEDEAYIGGYNMATSPYHNLCDE
jgi:hypothetical protein